MTVSWDLRPLVLDGVLGDKCSHIYGTHPQRTLPPCLIWLGTCILSHSGNSAASLPTELSQGAVLWYLSLNDFYQTSLFSRRGTQGQQVARSLPPRVCKNVGPTHVRKRAASQRWSGWGVAAGDKDGV